MSDRLDAELLPEFLADEIPRLSILLAGSTSIRRWRCR